MSEKALNEHEAAATLGLSVATLRAWRNRNKGPRYVRLGRAVRYTANDIERFVAENTVDTKRVAPAKVLEPGDTH